MSIDYDLSVWQILDLRVVVFCICFPKNSYKETFTYDANGNIKTNTLHNKEGNQVDNATYHYFAQTNKLHYINDSYGETQAGFDLMNQNVGNFAYDLIGNLVKDKAMQVSTMSWTAYHKREKVVKEDGTTITYRYDAMNNRIYKKVEGQQGTETTHYLHDGTGNTLAIYKDGKLEELNIYGSSRLGTYNGKTVAGKRTLGNKRYELSNHLGNALVVITDNKLGKDIDNDFIADTYIAMVVSERDYLAFGAVMYKRSYENEDYTYSFNGKELDPATGWQDYGFRDYNPVYKRFDSVDPLTQKYPELTPYQFASNTPIMAIDLDGLEAEPSTDEPDSKTGLTNADERMLKILNHSSHTTHTNMRAIRRVAKRFKKAKGNWSEVKLKNHKDYNAAFDLAVNLPINKAIEGLDDNINIQQVANDQALLIRRSKDDGKIDDTYYAQGGLQSIVLANRVISGSVRPFTMSGNNQTFRRVFSSNIIRRGFAMAFADPRRNIDALKIIDVTTTISTNMGGSVTYTGYSSALTGSGGSGEVLTGTTSLNFNFNSGGGVTTISGLPYLNLDPDTPDAAFNLTHSNSNATMGMTITLGVYTAIYLDVRSNKQPYKKSKALKK
ncbi:RHS repeat-associated core domain protein [Bernardetia litoralis DSM 6794]|uniref:RHS repeat-associated core domain protein n=1 Tax=Bernardetia litoralis (strain ATCC 23117 / DSM 6794 / NBRC 15988 / NCIMB 1366 / Fx l1 / Sio-4) TaxID=880071 RepID=I4AF51_BERLS|nr:RHS repeat-associated core domain-containing protein [Bernardetia litoralis]AFM02586.1 RHS repeat-associated core domain protein [Bernardetia litoralis DSM 6794]